MKTKLQKPLSTNHKINGLQYFLLVCSGANIHILKKTPSEWNKFSGIGGIVFFTAVFATLSAGYAIYTIFDNFYISLIFALIWGLMIFNLDRYIVSSIKKTSSWWQQILMAVPRLILATFLGIIISKPLELKIFEKEINKQLNTIIQRNNKELQQEMQSRILTQSSPFETEKKQIQEKILTYQKAYDSASVELEKEVLGKSSALTSGKEGFGPNAKRKSELKEQRRLDLENYQKQVAPRLEYLDKEISKVYSNVENERLKTEDSENRFNGFAARLQALDELGENTSIIAVAAMFIMGLFICLEISPVIVKLISGVGPYDFLLEKNETEFKVYAQEKIEKNQIASEKRLDEFKNNLN
ncbi:DUF4407 domain-containing protein [Riemerella anatipestifer]|uniref:DUF4407 domain-containing protein n=1 Tax=Riemerella anatipestifer TaxID=34085 RepID=A0AAP6LJN1_RIEAN|nr:DUF4407 domain-containing protein [Riemerella anatipestifer]MBT0548798.1 DUF4407 domain-containing protein [Riemerella anatipestifer]MBT0555111.1 DUF4407 domain-containing protein [Riemerella anatipestifer]MBT0559561.1 DUF4407 domain-containing protein [Riemerella anatipestifer]MCD5968390.1 DUF4407 domain-containing protein [Riemerella anatipestifer]MCO7354871.1 DUF4407 domain-containing protein [Riemerella anatipestifer]